MRGIKPHLRLETALYRAIRGYVFDRFPENAQILKIQVWHFYFAHKYDISKLPW